MPIAPSGKPFPLVHQHPAPIETDAASNGSGLVAMTPSLIADARAASAPSPAGFVSSRHFVFGAAPSVPEVAHVQLRLRNEPRPDDVAAIGHMLRATGFFSDEEIAVAGQIIEQRLREGASSEYATILADDEDGLLIGYVCFGRAPFTQASYDV